jgi:hypothetical protein
MTYSARHILQDIIREEKAAEQKQDLKKLLEEQKLDQEPELVRIGGKLTYVVGTCFSLVCGSSLLVLSIKVIASVVALDSKIVRDTAVSFSEELTGNMRTLKPKGNPLLERFDSLHKRNMIQINGPMKTRKRKVKIIEAKK